MQKKVLVSVLVPVYGVEKYIERCARSLFNQSYENCEFIFVNDCTKDNSISILQRVIAEYPDLKIRIYFESHLYNRGLGAARLTGFRKAKGDYITFVDSDDYVEIDYVERMVNLLEEKDADLIISSNRNQNGEVEYLQSQELLKRILCRRQPPRIWGNLIKKDLCLKKQIAPIEGIDHAEDYHFMCKYVSVCDKIYGIKRVLYHYTEDNSNSYSNNYTDKSAASTFASVKSTNDYLMNKDHTKYTSIIPLSTMEFLKFMKGELAPNSRVFCAFYDYLSNIKLSPLQKLELYALKKSYILFAKVISLYLYNRIKIER